ncbi:homoserine dehydrogenase [Falsibacillus albus]|uniref:Homoserine dehydrogenase n=1 Tax=Falsibacillus albus TaxID=2478915 RepID=A0A3L7JNE7_9BACI|nr:homoserine dehydrogenase [Falsibacillus albus]RLQ91181.1 homoserine dehydrogenase [Falsibacillus albus]
MTINAVLLGFGTVGQGVYQTIHTHRKELKELLGTDIEIKGVLVKDEHKIRPIDQDILVTSNFSDLLKIPQLDLVIEAIVGCEPAFTYNKAFLQKGIPVVTANKEMVAHKGSELKRISEKNDVSFSYEAAVAGGIPVIGVISRLLHANRINKIEGILNGTSNFILSTMRKEQTSFEETLQRAQEKGYAEADPSNDILGRDSFYKIMILSDLVFGGQPDWEQTECTGIDEVTIENILKAQEVNKRIKLIAAVERDESETIKASVKPVLLDSEHPLYAVEDVDNAVNIQTDLLGNLLLKGPGAGGLPTASAILQDVALLFGQKEKEETVYASARSIAKRASPY